MAWETPAPVTGFMSTLNGDRLCLAWDIGAAIVSQYHLRHLGPDASGGWQQAVLVDRQIIGNRIVLPARDGRYLIKVVSLFGRESVSAAEVIVQSAALAALNVVETLDEHPAWRGRKTAGLTRHDGVHHDGVLLLMSRTAIGDWPSLAAIHSIGGDGGVAPEAIAAS